jgi:hypothetical protein
MVERRRAKKVFVNQEFAVYGRNVPLCCNDCFIVYYLIDNLVIVFHGSYLSAGNPCLLPYLSVVHR